MTSNDPITGLMDQLAAHREQVTRLDTREADHVTAITGDAPGKTGGPQGPVGPMFQKLSFSPILKMRSLLTCFFQISPASGSCS